jgi:hypothetical protein
VFTRVTSLASHYFADRSTRGGVAKFSDVHSFPTSLQVSFLDLPNEILSHILELGYLDFNADDAPDTAFRALASRISPRLQQLVLHTPSLWSVIHISPNNFSSQLDALPQYLSRSMEHPLNIRLRCFWEPPIAEEIIGKLMAHIHRWKQLSVTIVNDFALTLLEHEGGAPLLEHLDITYHGPRRNISIPRHAFGGHLPRLKHLHLRNIDINNLAFSLRGLQTLEIRGYGTWPEYPQLNEVLGGSECLENLTLHISPRQVLNQVFPNQAWNDPHPQILLPELRSVTIYTSEWLSYRIAVFIQLFAYPKLDALSLHDSSTSLNEKSPTIMSYKRGTPHDRFPNRLVLRTCSLYWGCQAMSGVTITTLELRGVHWPTHTKLKSVFQSLKALVNLLLCDLNPKRALLSILGDDGDEEGQQLSLSNLSEIEATVDLARLEHLRVEFTERTWSPQDSTKYYTSAFLRIFTFPGIRSLHFANLMDKAQWKGIVDIFTSYAPEYLALTSLTLTGMTDLIPTNPQDPYYTDIAVGFPHLRRLSLDGFASSNALLQQLTPLTTPSSRLLSGPSETTPSAPSSSSVSVSTLAFPGLRSLSLRGDPYVSRPLLHRVIAVRGEAGVPLTRLDLDHRFAANAESLAWIREHVEVVEVEPMPAKMDASG